MLFRYRPATTRIKFFAVLIFALSAGFSPLAPAQTSAPGSEETAGIRVGDVPTSAAESDNAGSAVPALGTVTVTAERSPDSLPGGSRLDESDLAWRRAGTSDSARLLQDVPGVSVYGAGGISGLPVIHGLADDRLHVQVDGMDLMPACPNHMNSTLSYIDPTRVTGVQVFAGITPVSVGGDRIGGAIQMHSAPPRFAEGEESTFTAARAGAFFRSNGRAHGHHLGATLADRNLSLTYRESESQSNNTTAGGRFKAPGIGSLLPGGKWLAGNEIGSSAYRDSGNRDVDVALRSGNQVLRLRAGEQKVGFEGFPNQRMDMTANQNSTVNLDYLGNYDWGDLEIRTFDQDTRHEMDMGADRFFYGFGMPMRTLAKTRGTLIKAEIEHGERDIFRIGAEQQSYTLDDWWPPVGLSGSMAPNPFWNIRQGKRDRVGFFAEWQARWNSRWLTLLGVRSDTVKSDAGEVQGYNNMGIWRADAQAFNALNRRRTDHHLDTAVLVRYTPDARQTYEAGFAQKTRSPNLYERYPWSTNAMAALMNNFVGDGNGYIGNPDLRPEVAHTFSLTGDWHDADDTVWGVRISGHVTKVRDFIDARRCDFGQCSAANATATTGFVLLQYVNQSARLQGIDISGHRLLGKSEGFGSFTGSAILSYVEGKNLDSGDNLYHMMPLNAKLTLVQRLGSWTNSAEIQLVAAKERVSRVRNEVPTDDYALLNLHASYAWKHARVDVDIENVFNRFYYAPLGGAYVGQGMSMSTATIPWGTSVPGSGRSVNIALNLYF